MRHGSDIEAIIVPINSVTARPSIVLWQNEGDSFDMNLDMSIRVSGRRRGKGVGDGYGISAN